MKSNYKPIGNHIRLVDERNKGLQVQQLLGLSISKQFIPSVANIIGTDMENYKIIRKNQFACSTMQVRRDKKMPVALLKDLDEAIISQAYPIFEVKDEKELLPEYLMMWFERSEFDREACFHAVGGVRGSLEWEDFENMQLPIPHIDKQREIVKDYNTIQNRIALNQQLIQKLEETAQAIYREWFVEGIDFENLPEGWRVGQLEDTKLSTLGGDWGKDIAIDNYNKEVFCIRGTDIPTSNIGQIGNLPTRFILSKNLINRKLEPFDIVTEISGGSPTQSTGRSVLLTSEYLEYLNKDIICSNFCRVIKAKDNFSIFLFSSIVHLYNSNVLFTYENSSNGVKNLAIDDLFKEQLIPIPDTETLERYNNSFLRIYRQISILGKENEKLTELKELLLSKLATKK
ncbi:MAG: restriction endonuclease subunit S [Bacteroidetes bacterium]|nr:restriction endonuclease subunit S [Bacteroidota bacterium]